MKDQKALSIHLKNLREFSLRESISREQRQLILDEISDIIIDERDGYGAESPYERFRGLLEDIGATDLARFSLKLATAEAASSGTRRFSVSEEGTSAAPGSHGKIAMVKNRYCEEAFSILGKRIKAPKPIYVQSFSDACEAIAGSSCEFALLPTESVQNGRLFGFYSMLDRYELKICAACILEGENDGESIRYALVGRNFSDKNPRSRNLVFEFSLISDGNRFPSDVLTVASILSADIVKIDSLPVAYDDTEQKYFFTLSLTSVTAAAMDLYLSHERKGYTKIGLYPIIN